MRWVLKSSDDVRALQGEIEQKREQVARLQQERTDLELEIAAFEIEYAAEVKPLQDELDQVQRHIDEYGLRIEMVRLRGNRVSPGQIEAEVEHRLRARDQRWQSEPHPRPEWASAPVDPQTFQAELKTVYRELARRFHPDLAEQEDERAARGARMAEINAAYAVGDLETLRRIASSAAEGLSSGRRALSVEDLLAERERLDGLIVRLRASIAELNRDPLLLLKLDSSLARHQGRNLLAEMAIELHIRLVERQGELKRSIAQFRDLVEQAGFTS